MKKKKSNTVAYEPIHPWRWRFLAIWIIIFTVFVGIGIQQNSQRIHDIQNSRKFSCEQTYSKLTQILKISGSGRHFNFQEKQKFDHLLNLVNPAQCGKQVKTRIHN